MSGLNHDFLLVSRKEHEYSEYLDFINDPNALQIHDDVLGYMADTLKWIPSYNPAKAERCSGLCWYGPTVIKSEGARIAARIFHAWAELFSYGPKRLQLTGAWGVEEGRPFAEGDYKKIRVDRDVIVRKLKRLAAFAEEVAASNDELYILHLGI
jgi:hypothetical protein